MQKTIPIPKDSHIGTVETYRPISDLSTIDKIFEKILHTIRNLLAESQYGFRKGRGTDKSVINVVNLGQGLLCVCRRNVLRYCESI